MAETNKSEDSSMQKRRSTGDKQGSSPKRARVTDLPEDEQEDEPRDPGKKA